MGIGDEQPSFRRVARELLRETYWCACYSTYHQLVLWVMRDDPTRLDPDDTFTTLEVGFSPQGLRARIGCAWQALRGEPAPFAEVILPYAETVALREGLDRNLRVIEMHTTPVGKD